MILPSKELLSAVLDLEVFDIHSEEYPKQHGNVVYFKTNSRGIPNEENFHNIYELAHKCKEWCFTNGYCLQSNLHKHGTYSGIFTDSSYECPECNNIDATSFVAYTEPEAVFKACEYILTTLITKDNQ